MKSVSSSAISSVGYEGSTLAVTFHNSGTYYHYGVPFWVYAGLMKAASKGAYYNENVKGRF